MLYACNKSDSTPGSNNSIIVESYYCEGKNSYLSCDANCEKIKVARLEFLVDKKNQTILKKVYSYFDFEKKIQTEKAIYNYSAIYKKPEIDCTIFDEKNWSCVPKYDLGNGATYAGSAYEMTDGIYREYENCYK